MTPEQALKYIEGEIVAINRVIAELQAVMDRRKRLRELPPIVPSRSEEVN